MTTSQDFSASPETLPTSTIFPWSIRIESPLVMGFLHSPLTIVPKLTIAVFISALPSCRTEISEDPPSPSARRRAHNLHQAIFPLDVLKLQSTDARIQPSAICDTKHDGDLVGQWRILQRDGHAVITGADVKRIFAGERNVNRCAVRPAWSSRKSTLYRHRWPLEGGLQTWS